jgi:transcriptional regulator with XRE-family HTH domain
MTDRQMIAQGIRRALARKGLSQTELARRGGWSSATVGKWVTAGSIPSDKNLNRLCALLDVDYVDIQAGLPNIWSTTND